VNPAVRKGQIGNDKRLGYEIETWIMLFDTAIGGRFNGNEQDEA
jgi:hypothetical protein